MNPRELEWFEGERPLPKESWEEQHGKVLTRCTAVHEWRLQKFESVPCGISKVYKAMRKRGVKETHKEQLTSTVKSSLGNEKFVKLEASISGELGYEFLTEEYTEEGEETTVTAPECGRRHILIYDHVKTFKFEVEDKRFFRFRDLSVRFPIEAFTGHVWWETPTLENDEECGCKDEHKEPDGYISLNCNLLNITSPFYRSGDSIHVSAIERTFSEDEVLRLVVAGLPVTAKSLPPIVRFLGDIESTNDVELRYLSSTAPVHAEGLASSSGVEVEAATIEEAMRILSTIAALVPGIAGLGLYIAKLVAESRKTRDPKELEEILREIKSLPEQKAERSVRSA